MVSKSILEIFFMGRKVKYDKELKLIVIEEYLSDKYSLEGLANKYNISSDGIVRQWSNGRFLGYIKIGSFLWFEF